MKEQILKINKLYQTNKVILTFFFLTLINCNQSENLEKLLTNNNYKFWDIYYPNEPLKKQQGFCLTKDHNCYLYDYTREGKRNKFYFGDIKISESWIRMNNNKFIMMGDIEVINLTEDTLKIYNYPFYCETILIKSQDQKYFTD